VLAPAPLQFCTQQLSRWSGGWSRRIMSRGPEPLLMLDSTSGRGVHASASGVAVERDSVAVRAAAPRSMADESPCGGKDEPGSCAKAGLAQNGRLLMPVAEMPKRPRTLLPPAGRLAPA